MTSNDRFYAGLLAQEAIKTHRLPSFETACDVIPHAGAARDAAAIVRRCLGDRFGCDSTPTEDQLKEVLAVFVGACVMANVEPSEVLAAVIADRAGQVLDRWSAALAVTPV